MQRPERRRGPRRWWHAAAGLLLASVGLAPATTLADSGRGQLEPYTARYQVSYRGLAGGQIEASLKPGSEPGIWVYETRAFPNFLGRLAISASAREHGTMEISPAGVRPLEFEFNDGSAEEAKDIRVRFDWAAGRVTGEADGEPFAYDVEPGTQDTASIQAAMLVELLAGRAPTGFPILAGGKLRQYRYWSEGTEKVTTPAGQYDTVIWASQREGSSRVSRVWHAPALGFVPVQAIQYRKGRPEFAMKLASLSRP
jgi:Protein of unknown function (DUF3108)